MTTDITIIDQYSSYDQDEIERLTERNTILEKEVKRLRKDKEQLQEQLVLIKGFSDSLWERLKAIQWI